MGAMDEQDAPPQGPPRRLTRSGHDRMVAGVCGGLADFTGIDPVVFRVVFAVAAVMGGAGIAAYVLAWLIIPAAPGAPSALGDLLGERGDRPSWWLAVPLVLVFLLLAGSFGAWRRHWVGGGFGLLVVVGLGLWLWSRHDRPALPASAPAAGPPAHAVVTGGDTTTVVTAPPPATPVPPAHRRERSTLGILTVSMMILVVGVLQAIEAGSDHDFAATTVLASALAVVGAGLLLGTVVGRSRGLIVLGVVLTVLAAVSSVADVPLRGGAGERRWAPTSAAVAERSYRLGAGNARLDLSAIDLAGRRTHIDASVGMGRLSVDVPDGVDLEIRAHTGFGDIDVLGDVDDGVDVTKRAEIDEPFDEGTLVLDLRVGMGQLEVRR